MARMTTLPRWTQSLKKSSHIYMPDNNANRGNRIVRWQEADFEGKRVPLKTKEFLVEHGLPEVISSTTFEFGPCVSEGVDLVIGVDYEHPILVGSSGIITIEQTDEAIFLNSNVQALAECIAQFEFAQHIMDIAEIEAVEAIADFRSRLTTLDPLCLATSMPSVWRTLIEDYK
jgi:hypothetical protein